MSYQKQNSMRAFHVYPGPHVADPAWICPVVEHVHSNTVEGECIKIIRYTDGDELMKVAQEVRDNILRQQAREETIDEVLGDLGVTRDEWIRRKMAAAKDEAAADGPETCS